MLKINKKWLMYETHFVLKQQYFKAPKKTICI